LEGQTSESNDGGIGRAFGRYRQVLGIPQVPASVFTALLGRIPFGMIGLAIVLLIRQQTGSYAIAGAVAGASAIFAGLIAPPQGRLIDRFGIPRVIVPLAFAEAIAVAVLLKAAHGDSSDAVLVAAGALVGLVSVPLFAAVQSLLTSLARPRDLVETAFALEAVLQEFVFLGGPVLVAVLVAIASPSAAVAACGVLTLIGGLSFAATRGARNFRSEPGEHGRALGALASPAIRTFTAVGLASGLIFGTLEVAMPAFAGEHGSSGTAGVLLAAIALGSMIGGLWHGTRPNAESLVGRYYAYLWLLALGLVPVALVGSNELMFVAALVGGFFVAPSFAAGLALLSKLAPEGKTTEAFTWLDMAVVIGIATGNALGGIVVEGSGVKLALIAPCVFAAIAATIAVVRRSTLEPVGSAETA
jgi:MFS family permease